LFYNFGLFTPSKLVTGLYKSSIFFFLSSLTKYVGRETSSSERLLLLFVDILHFVCGQQVRCPVIFHPIAPYFPRNPPKLLETSIHKTWYIFAQIFPKLRSHLKILVVRIVAKAKFHDENQQNVGAVVEKF
jgi:hypothetical protein